MRRLAFSQSFDRSTMPRPMKRAHRRIGDDLGKALVCGCGDHRGELVAGVVGILGERRGGFIAELGERPFRLHLGASLERDGDQRLAARGLKRSRFTLLVRGTFEFLRVQHRGEVEKILLRALRGGGVVTAGAFHFDAKEGAPTMVPLAAIGTSFCEAVLKPAGPPRRSLPFMRSSSVTKKSIGLLSAATRRATSGRGRCC